MDLSVLLTCIQKRAVGLHTQNTSIEHDSREKRTSPGNYTPRSQLRSTIVVTPEAKHMFIFLLTGSEANNNLKKCIRTPWRKICASLCCCWLNEEQVNHHWKRSAFCIFVVYCVSFLANQSSRTTKTRVAGCFKSR